MDNREINKAMLENDINKIKEKEFKNFLNTLTNTFDKEHLKGPMFKHFFKNLKYFKQN